MSHSCAPPTRHAHADPPQLYYNKRSQYVSGNETDKVQVCVGQRVSLRLRCRDHRSIPLTLSPGHQRQDKGARLPGLQGPHHQRRLPGLRSQHRHPSHRRDLQQVPAPPQVHPDLRPRYPDQWLLRPQRHLPLHHRRGGRTRAARQHQRDGGGTASPRCGERTPRAARHRRGDRAQDAKQLDRRRRG